MIPTLGGIAFVVIIAIFCIKEKARRAAIKQEDEHWFERELYFWREGGCYKSDDDETFYEFFNDAYGTEEDTEQDDRRDDDNT